MTFKNQDWLTHIINFILVFVSVVVGISATALYEKNKAKDDARHLLKEFYSDLQTQKCLIEGVIQYYSISSDAATSSISYWETKSNISDREFVDGLIKASQIVTPPITLSMYEPLFGKDELRLLNEQSFKPGRRDVRKELTKFFSYDTDVFKYDALLSPYRSDIRRLMPYSIQLSYCPDNNSKDHDYGVQHGSKCNLVRHNDFKALAQTFRQKTDVLENLTQYASNLRLTLKHLSDYRTNMIVVEQAILENNPQFEEIKVCVAPR